MTSQENNGLATVALRYGPGLHTRSKADLRISTPVGLMVGDTFRIVFLTDALTQASSDQISTYNSSVTSDATAQAGGNVVYDGTILTWSGIASTESTSAITDIGEMRASWWLANGQEVSSTDTSTGLLDSADGAWRPMAAGMR
jgi:hypothetical protein